MEQEVARQEKRGRQTERSRLKQNKTSNSRWQSRKTEYEIEKVKHIR